MVDLWVALLLAAEPTPVAVSGLEDAWTYVSTSPLLGLGTTLIAYRLAHWLYTATNGNPWMNPVVTSVVILISFLQLTDISYEAYFEGGQFVHFLLGPATVALAVPLFKQCSKLRRLWLPMAITLISGVSIAAMSSIAIAWVLGASAQTQLSLAPKSATAPVAMGISEQIGGLPALTAVLVVTTGIIGALLGSKLFDWMKIENDNIRGVAMGLTAHGIGTARAFQISPEMGAFSGLAMALSALTTAVIVPGLLTWMGLI